MFKKSPNTVIIENLYQGERIQPFIHNMQLNKIINQRVGLGKFQIQTFLILCLVDLNDGVEIILSSFLNPIIKGNYPHVSSSMISLMASVFYIGSFLGSIISGIYADKYGRKRLIRYGSIMQIVSSFLFYFSNSFESLLYLRLLYGFSFGFTIVVTTSMFAEVSPQKYRGKGILLINFCISFGKIYGVLLGYLFLSPNIIEGNWKAMMICGTIPNIIVFLGSLYILEQSPRYYIVHRQLDQAYRIINKMLTTNNPNSSLLSEQQKQKIEVQANEISGTEEHNSLLAIFNKQYRITTITLVLIWLIINFCFYGQLVVQAYHMKSNSAGKGVQFMKYFLTVLGQIPSLLISFYLIDRPNFGRKNSLTYFFIGAAVCHLSYSFSSFTFFASLSRFFMKDVYQILYPLSTESFETKIRTKGFGFCSGFGRLATVVMPFILFPLDDWSPKSVYITFAILCFLAGYLVFTIIKETMHLGLDQNQQKLIRQVPLQQRLLNK